MTGWGLAFNILKRRKWATFIVPCAQKQAAIKVFPSLRTDYFPFFANKRRTRSKSYFYTGWNWLELHQISVKGEGAVNLVLEMKNNVDEWRKHCSMLIAVFGWQPESGWFVFHHPDLRATGGPPRVIGSLAQLKQCDSFTLQYLYRDLQIWDK